ncbi:hypothetical protein K737_300088 [Holospora undulata HU1]|uniref:Uncharacterized protein n=1 Tax=Holospora undulata HU1 TaxID=1321371 RepID=A0A061JJ05_9PROT|nr:hypothetical protein K737_300088 [Holospora undulata HU1]
MLYSTLFRGFLTYQPKLLYDDSYARGLLNPSTEYLCDNDAKHPPQTGNYLWLHPIGFEEKDPLYY